MSDLINEEILQETMEEVPKTASRYVSCIRINGSPILPPLIDDRYRGELIHYRNLAILLEKKIRDRKKLKDNRQSVDSGVMIGVSSTEPSWLRSCILRRDNKEELIAPNFFDSSKNKSSCETLCLHRSNSSDDTCSKNFICDHNMCTYLSNCDEQFSSAWFDNQSEEFLCNFDAGLTENSDHSTLTEKVLSCNSYRMPFNESQAKDKNNISDKAGMSPNSVSDGVTRLSVFYAEYHKDIDKQNFCIQNIDTTNKNGQNNTDIFNSYNCTRTTQRSEDDCGVFLPQLETETLLNKCASDKAFRNHITDAVSQEIESGLNGEMETSEYEHYFANFSALSDSFTNLDCSFKSTNSKDHSPNENVICNMNSTRKEPLSSSFETSHCESTIVHQESASVEHGSHSKNMYNKPLKHTRGNKFKISCSSVSLPEYPTSRSALNLDTQKPEKPYNPMHYDGGNRVDIENNNKETFNPKDTSNIIPRKWLCDRMTNMSDDSGEDLSKGTVNENALDPESSSASQKLSCEVPLSESVSISEVDFHSSSVATIGPDTSEETNELPNHLSVEKENELIPPKLVRQNSYTLIAPSPILLAHAKANEKQEKKTSLDDNSGNQVKVNHKCQEFDEAKADCDLKEGVKYVYAVPYKQNQCVIQNVKNTNKAKTKENSTQRGNSLPGSTVSSPIKVNLFHSSLDNLPIVTVRRFQELIDRKSLQNQPHKHSKTNILSGQEISPEKKMLSTRSSSLDLQKLNRNSADNTLRCRSKSDLQDSKCKESFVLSSTQKDGNKMSKNDVEILYRETSFEPSLSKVLQQSDMNYISTPNSNQSNQANFEELSPSFSVGMCSMQSEDKVEETEMMPVCNALSLSDTTVQQIFLQLQNQHSVLMSQLLDRQKKEQEALANTFLNQQRQILQEMRFIPSSSADVESPSANSDTGSSSIEKKSPSAPQESEMFGSVSVGSHLSSTVEMPQPSGSSNSSRYSNNADISSTTRHCSKELNKASPALVPQKAKPHITGEQITAATVINAAARGFLIRRLLKTEHVQEIINTISESVQCALQLQRECPIDITPSDVELHRRLIQQLTAACYSLHDTFFALSTQEKMNIIANDREKRRNPASRPSSARTSISTATQKYIQRKQQQNRQSERPAPNTRRSWWRSKARACSAGEAPSWLPQQYPAWLNEQSSSSYSKQPIVVTSKQQQCNNRAIRRPWR